MAKIYLIGKSHSAHVMRLRSDGHLLTHVEIGPDTPKAIRSAEHPDCILFYAESMNDLVMLATISAVAPLIVSADSDGDFGHAGTVAILALHLGAHGWIPTGSNSDELSAQIKSLLRRTREGVSDYVDLHLNERQGVFTANGSRVALTKSELEIVALLLQSPGVDTQYGHIAEMLWRNQSDQFISGTLKSHVYHINKKLKAAGTSVRITTRRRYGVGLSVQHV